VNINSFTFNSAISHSMEPNVVSEDINISISRSKSNLVSSNLSKELLTHSDLSSVSYIDRIEA